MSDLSLWECCPHFKCLSARHWHDSNHNCKLSHVHLFMLSFFWIFNSKPRHQVTNQGTTPTILKCSIDQGRSCMIFTRTKLSLPCLFVGYNLWILMHLLDNKLDILLLQGLTLTETPNLFIIHSLTSCNAENTRSLNQK